MIATASTRSGTSCAGMKSVLPLILVVWLITAGTGRAETKLGDETTVVFATVEQGREILERAGLAMIESDLIGVELPTGHQPLLQVCTALLQAEVNIIQAYPLLVRPRGNPAVALMVDNIEMGLDTLANKGFTMITEGDLSSDD